MYHAYLIAHFLLMLLWIIPAMVSDYRFLVHFRTGSREQKIGVVKRIQALSGKTEMVASFFVPLVGILLLIQQSFWLKEGVMHAKILLALVAIGSYHASRGKLKTLLNALESGDSTEGLPRRYMLLRSLTLILLVGIVWLITSFKGAITTLNLIRSWFG
ncbi:MAG: hypothetical protein ACE5HZ_01895 [Fidelibacterota bacterium]